MSYHRTTVVHWFDFDRWEQRCYVNDPHGNKTSAEYRYMAGETQPNYPMPATLHDADISIMHLSLSACRYRDNNGPCCICIDRWLEELDYNFGET